MWTVDGEALENGTPERLVQFVVSHACPGAIILLHNGRGTTVEALPGIVQGLRKRGFQLVTLDQLVGTRGPRGTVSGVPPATGLKLFGSSAD
jgi:peptidoglycan/xylan/chitin deacetylase (PgdA/CDA1 family)